MSPFVLFIATAAMGIDVGWEPLPDGGHQYTIQIEPQLLDVLKQGKDEIISEVPPQVHIRHFRIIAGTGQLPRVDGPPAVREAETHEPAADHAAQPPKAEHELSLGQQEPPATPAELPSTTAAPAPLGGQQTGFDLPAGGSKEVDANKPSLEPEARPWLPLAIAGLLLCCSLGANFYLGWIAWDARARYRAAIAKVRPAPAG